MAAAKTAPASRSILVERSGGKDMIVEDIPGDAKITFGALHPGTKDGTGYGRAGSVLRIYQGSATGGNQLMVITDVVSFRDLSLKIKQKKITVKDKSKAQRGPDGTFRATENETTTEWVDVDDEF